MSLKPIKIWGRLGPNPPKVAMVCEELSLPHEFMPITYAEVKNPEYLAVNPNGRLPSIRDDNTGITLWESCAILEYLVDKYDTERTISFEPGTPEFYLAKQYLFFQASGQGPYYGQYMWFAKFHSEKIPSAVERYVNETKRVTGTLESILKKQKEETGAGPWLVGGKFSYVDLAWLSWQLIANATMKEHGFDSEEYPMVKEWLGNMMQRPALKTTMDYVFTEMAKLNQ